MIFFSSFFDYILFNSIHTIVPISFEELFYIMTEESAEECYEKGLQYGAEGDAVNAIEFAFGRSQSVLMRNVTLR